MTYDSLELSINEARRLGLRYVIEFEDGLYGGSYHVPCRDPGAEVRQRARWGDEPLIVHDLERDPLDDFHPPLEYRCVWYDEPAQPAGAFIEALDRLQKSVTRLELSTLRFALEFERRPLHRLRLRWRLFVRSNIVAGRHLADLGF